ncbi:MAG: DUF2007 domain-containing protein [Paraglaciecola sp.]|nr:DUF2007 domain-containing protein [Paraglaciecola sp.]NCT48062.1 DUF2007 domain-containing protein [Paraglaciecola sp.]
MSQCKVFCHHDRFRVWQVKQLLEQNGMACFIKNEFAIGAMGELSPFDVLPEVWLHDAQWLAKADRVIAEFNRSPSDDTPWFCPSCQEQNAANFELCWQCGSEPQSYAVKQQ